MALGLIFTFGSAPALADGGVTFDDIAENGGAGITYQRVASPRLTLMDAIEALGTLPGATWRDVRAYETPMKANGAPGVALLDFDRDGDVDIYVPNGPGAANSLYSNQLVETGQVTFVDVATSMGADATAQDSSGVCYGDLDNDGDEDIYVLGTGMPNVLLANQLAETGVASFVDITASAGVGAGNRHPSACTVADFDGNGLLDLAVGNTYDDWTHRQPTFVNAIYPGLEHNQLFLNMGGSSFVDASASSGIETIVDMPGGTYTWALSSADYDLDGDVDLIFADTQGAAPTNVSEERGYNRIFQNDGTGQFTDVTAQANLRKFGSWMGHAWADLNCDGNLDFFSTNLGDYVSAGLGITPTRWFLGQGDGTFSDPGVGDLVSSAFGWGTVATDYDNDGDTDIVYHGGMDVMTVLFGDNPGLVLQNEGCSADFSYDFDSVVRDHRPRSVQGLAKGDLDGNGFEDLVSVSDSIVQLDQWWLPWSGVLAPPFGSPLDPIARFQGVWIGGGGVITYLSPTILPGDLSVELNSGGNGNGSVSFDMLGGSGLVADAGVNRNGIGAVLSFTPDGGATSMVPVVGGASYGSQDELAMRFGLGTAAAGTVDVLWPGGVRNRLYDVAVGERVTLPEIPCSYDGDWKNFGQYNACVMQALNGYKDAGVITAAEKNRLRDSARRAFDEAR